MNHSPLTPPQEHRPLTVIEQWNSIFDRSYKAPITQAANKPNKQTKQKSRKTKASIDEFVLPRGNDDLFPFDTTVEDITEPSVYTTSTEDITEPSVSTTTTPPTPANPVPRYIQQRVSAPKQQHNFFMGDPPYSMQTSSTITALTKNPNGIIKAADRLTREEWKAASIHSKQKQINILGLPETNLQYTKQRTSHLLRDYRHFNPNAAIATSRSTEPTNSPYQPGGTLTAIDSAIAIRTKSRITDPSGMGRWSGFCIQRPNTTDLMIITAYRVCKQTARAAGSSTAYLQQYRILRNSGDPKPNPRRQTLTDLGKLIQQYHQTDATVLLMIDANEDIHGKEGMADFIATTGLIDCYQYRHPHSRETHLRGSKQIDFILITANAIQALLSSTLCAFHEEPYENSDRCGVTATFENNLLLGPNSTAPSIRAPRHLFSHHPNILARFIKTLQTKCNKQQLLSRHAALLMIEVQDWNGEHHLTLDDIDAMYTQSTLQAEAKCAFPSDSPWTPNSTWHTNYGSIGDFNNPAPALCEM